MMTTQLPEKIRKEIDGIQRPVVFLALSGSHRFGFASPDSDWDIRGTFLLTLEEAISLYKPDDEINRLDKEPPELDLVLWELQKMCELLLKKNGNVLEQIFSPLVIKTSSAHEELREIARDCVTRHHVQHYRGFFLTQWKLLTKESPVRIKPLLYAYRTLLTGVHLMRTGEVEANLETLAQIYGYEYLLAWIEEKRTGTEQGTNDAVDVEFHERQLLELEKRMLRESDESGLPDKPNGKAALNDWYLRLRLNGLT